MPGLKPITIPASPSSPSYYLTSPITPPLASPSYYLRPLPLSPTTPSLSPPPGAYHFPKSKALTTRPIAIPPTRPFKTSQPPPRAFVPRHTLQARSFSEPVELALAASDLQRRKGVRWEAEEACELAVSDEEGGGVGIGERGGKKVVRGRKMRIGKVRKMKRRRVKRVVSEESEGEDSEEEEMSGEERETKRKDKGKKALDELLTALVNLDEGSRDLLGKAMEKLTEAKRKESGKRKRVRSRRKTRD